MATPAYKPNYTGTTLVKNDFNSNTSLTDWVVVDETGKRESKWQIVDGVLKDTNVTSTLGGNTMILHKTANWNRYEFGVDVVLPDVTGKSVGVVLGGDTVGKNYYYFRIFYNGQGFFKYLYKVTPQGTETLVREQKAGDFKPGDKVRITTFVENKSLKIYIGSVEAYSGDKLTGLKGTIGLYQRGVFETNAFDNLTVKELSAIPSDTPLLQKDFTNPEKMNFWLIKDETGKRESNWQVVNGAMSETSDATTDTTNGFAFLVYTAQSFTNYEYSVDVQLPTKNIGVGSKSAGVAFGFDKAGKYYYYLRVFMLGNDYYYQIVQSDAEGKHNVVPQEKIVGEIEAGSVARITVYAADANLKVYINDILLYTGMEPGLAGHIGLYVSGDMPNNAFDNIVVKNAVIEGAEDEEEEEGNNSPNNNSGSTGGNTGDNTGSTIKVPSYVPQYTGTILLDKNFNNQDALADWIVKDDSNRASNWQVVDGVLKETSDSSEKSGTAMLLYKTAGWTHYEFSVDMMMPGASGSVGKSLGLIFGADPEFKSYYYLRLFYNTDQDAFYMYLIRVTPEGNYNIVDQEKLYSVAKAGELARLTVFAEGKGLKIYFNDYQLFKSSELVGLKGHIGLYMRGDLPDNSFDNITVKEIKGNTTTANTNTGGGNSGGNTGYTPDYTGNTLLNKDFTTSENLNDWIVKDEVGKRDSEWAVADGVLKETSDSSEKAGDAVLIYKSNGWTHYEFSADMRLPGDSGAAGGKSVGLVFGSNAEGTNYYYFRIMYNGTSFFKYLYKVTNGRAETLVSAQPLSGLKKDAVVNVKAIVEGTSLKIYINNQEVYSGENMTNLNGTVGLYLRGDIPNNSFDNLIVKEIKGNVTEATYTITYKNTGAATNPNPTTYTANGAAGITLQAPGSITGYTFEGWYLNDQKITNLSGKTGNLVIEARWKNASGDYVELPSVGMK